MLSGAVYQATLQDVLRREFGHLRHAAKEIARLAGVSPRAAENWLDGLCAPQGRALVQLAANVREVDAAVEAMKAMARGGGGA